MVNSLRLAQGFERFVVELRYQFEARLACCSVTELQSLLGSSTEVLKSIEHLVLTLGLQTVEVSGYDLLMYYCSSTTSVMRSIFDF